MCLLLAVTNSLAATIPRKNIILPTTIEESSSSSSSSSSSLSKWETTINKTEKPAAVIRNSLLHLLSPESAASHSRLRKRHSKRQSNNFDGFDLDVNSTVLEWVNPCGGYFDPTAVSSHKPNRTAILEMLKKDIDLEFVDLRYRLQHIDTKSFQLWSLYEDRYKFLSKLKTKKRCEKRKIALKRWYRNIETYTATFAYLLRMQLKSLRSKAENEVVNELRTLLRSSRSTLCELEIAINKTHPNHPVRNHLPQVSRDEMNRHLKLITRQKAIENPGVEREVNSIDLIFSKVYYKRFLKKMGKTIEKTIENRETNKIEKNCGRKGLRKGGSNSNTRRKQKQKQNGHSRA